MLRQHAAWKTTAAKEKPMKSPGGAIHQRFWNQQADVVIMADDEINGLRKIAEVDVTFMQFHIGRLSKTPLYLATRQSNQDAIRKLAALNGSVIPHISRRAGRGVSNDYLVQLVHRYGSPHGLVAHGMEIGNGPNPLAVGARPEPRFQ
jgi:hypothetical protein